MAIVNAYYGFNFDNINMSRLNSGSNYFYDNKDIAGLGSNYEDTLELYFSVSGSNYLSGFFGKDFSFSGDIVTGGTARAYVEMQIVGGSAVTLFGAYDFNIPAAEIAATVYTSNVYDDLAMFTKLLSGDDLFNLSPYADRVYGFAGNDKFIGGAGNDYINGGLGIDISTYQGRLSEFRILIPTGTIADSIGNRDGTDTFTNIERLAFTDTMLALDTAADENAGNSYLLYQAAFDRTPDVEGLGYWISKVDSGANIVRDVAQNFILSNEFKSLYGANPSVPEFMGLLYQNVLNRTPDAEGLKYWLDEFAQAGDSTLYRAGLLNNFAISAENIANVASQIVDGIQYQAYVG